MKKRSRRIAALAALICILISLIGLMWGAFAGSTGTVLACLFILIVVPAVAFIFVRFTDIYTAGIERSGMLRDKSAREDDPAGEAAEEVDPAGDRQGHGPDPAKSHRRESVTPT